MNTTGVLFISDGLIKQLPQSDQLLPFVFDLMFERLMHEMSVKDDRFMSTFRAARRRLIDHKGWQIDSAGVALHKGRKVLTIPSPQRRLHPEIEWVMDSVPLVPAESSPAPLNPVEDGEAA